MSKQETATLKGVAILLMVFLHLFTQRQVGLYDSLIMIGDTPLPSILTRLTNPVPFFLFLSGYGLYASYQNGGGRRPWIRVFNIYIHLWLIYLIFIPLGSWIKPEAYPGSIETFLKNATSWQCSYIGEQWFLLPYILLMFFSKYIFRLCDKIRSLYVFGVSLSVYLLTSYVLKIYGEDQLASFSMIFYNLFLAFYMLLAFTLGMLAKREGWVEKTKKSVNKWDSKVPLCGVWFLLSLCIIKCIVSTSAFDPFYALAFILCFLTIPIGEWGIRILGYLGKHSMNIWLIHTWICIRLFQEEIYSLRWPVLIYVAVFALSLIVSHIVEGMFIPFKKFLK